VLIPNGVEDAIGELTLAGAIKETFAVEDVLGVIKL
jgi:hypothetical protein